MLKQVKAGETIAMTIDKTNHIIGYFSTEEFLPLDEEKR